MASGAETGSALAGRFDSTSVRIPDPRAVMTLGDLDQDGVAPAVGFVVASQLRPEFRGLDPDRGVDARVERLGLVEDPHTDHVLFEIGCAACRRLLDDEAQEADILGELANPALATMRSNASWTATVSSMCRPLAPGQYSRCADHGQATASPAPDGPLTALCNRLFNSNPTAG